MQELHRPRVVSAFAGRSHLLVRADAGWGKSVAARQAVAGLSHGWIDLTRHDRPLPVLLRRLVGALREGGAHVPDDVETLADTAVGPDASHDVPAVVARRFADVIGAGRAAPATDVSTSRPAVQPLPTVVMDGLDALADLQHDGTQPVSATLGLITELMAVPALPFRLIILTRRLRPSGVGRLLASRALVEVNAPTLAFTEAETHTVLQQSGLGDDGSLAAAGITSRAVQALTAGWPAAVHLTARALRDVPPAARHTVLDRAGQPGSGLGMLIAEELLDPLRPAARSALDLAAALPWVSPALWDALGIDSDSRDAVQALLTVGRDGWEVPVLLRRHVIAVPGRHNSDALAREQLLNCAASYYLDAGHPEAAIVTLADHPNALAELLDANAARLLAAGAVHELAQLDRVVPHDRRSAVSEEAIGNALMVLGDWSGAARAYQRAGDGAALTARLAWRVGLVHYLRGDVPEAREVYRSAVAGPDDSPDELALLSAMHAAASVAGGDLDEAVRLLASAPDPPDQHSVAALETSRAMVASALGNGPAHQDHTDRALAAARASHSMLQEIRIRSNHASWLVRHGHPETALEHLGEVMERAELSGFASIVGLAHLNQGEAHLKLGDLDAAATEFSASEAVFSRTASSMIRYPLIGLAQVNALTGKRVISRTRVVEALRLARCRQDVTAQVLALSLLARLLADHEPESARTHAQEALALATGRLSGVAHLSAGWAAVAQGDLQVATEHGMAAGEAARRAGEHLAQSEALALLAATHSDPLLATPLLRQALGLLQDRTDMLLDRDIGSALAHRSGQAAPSSRSVLAGPALLLPRLPSICIQVLGAFVIRRDGVVLPDTIWGSRKARDLVRILLARRGRPIPRDHLAELLWPDTAPHDIGNRLSQALSVARSVLDPDRKGGEGPLRATADAIHLRLDLVTVDSERFLKAADAALNEPEEDCGVACALALHTGTPFEDDPYPGWADPLIAEVRTTYLRLLRVQAVAVDIDVAIAATTRLLAEDPFDEPSHLALIQRLTDAGRHGQAAGAYRRYVARMGEIAVSPAPRPTPAPRLVG